MVQLYYTVVGTKYNNQWYNYTIQLSALNLRISGTVIQLSAHNLTIAGTAILNSCRHINNQSIHVFGQWLANWPSPSTTHGVLQGNNKLSPPPTVHSQPLHCAPAMLHATNFCLHGSLPGRLWSASLSSSLGCLLHGCFSDVSGGLLRAYFRAPLLPWQVYPLAHTVVQLYLKVLTSKS